MQVTFCVRPTSYISTLFRLRLKRQPADKVFTAAPRRGGVTRLAEADQKCMYWAVRLIFNVSRSRPALGVSRRVGRRGDVRFRRNDRRSK